MSNTISFPGDILDRNVPSMIVFVVWNHIWKLIFFFVTKTRSRYFINHNLKYTWGYMMNFFKTNISRANSSKRVSCGIDLSLTNLTELIRFCIRIFLHWRIIESLFEISISKLLILSTTKLQSNSKIALDMPISESHLIALRSPHSFTFGN